MSETTEFGSQNSIWSIFSHCHDTSIVVGLIGFCAQLAESIEVLDTHQNAVENAKETRNKEVENGLQKNQVIVQLMHFAYHNNCDNAYQVDEHNEE